MNEKTVELLRNKTILITGITGFVGKSINSFLQEMNRDLMLNVKVLGLARNPKKDMTGVQFIQHDLSDPLSIQEDIDFVIHASNPVFSPNANFYESAQTMFVTTKNVLDFVQKKNIKAFLLLSSGAVYGTINGPAQESDSLNLSSSAGINYYSIGKIQSENLVQSFFKNSLNQRGVIARAFSFSGRNLPLESEFAINSFVNKAVAGEDILIQGNPKTIRSYQDSKDLARWILTLLCCGENLSIYNVGSSTPVSIEELAQLVVEFSGSKSKVKVAEGANAKPLGFYLPSTKKAESDFGLINNITIKDSILSMIEERK